MSSVIIKNLPINRKVPPTIKINSELFSIRDITALEQPWKFYTIYIYKAVCGSVRPSVTTPFRGVSQINS